MRKTVPAAVPPREDRPAAAGLPDVDLMIGYKLRLAQLALFQDFNDTFARLKVRPAEFTVLAILARSPGLKQSQIAGMLGIKRANFVALMDNIERRGLAERRKAETDRRSHALHLTKEGEKFFRKLAPMWRRHEQRFIERLQGEAERDILIALLDRVIGHDGTDAPETAGSVSGGS